MSFDPQSIPSLPEHTSTSMLMGVRARDDAAWRRLVTLYGPMVFRWARRAGLQGQDAVDVVQDVFLSVWSDIDQFSRAQVGSSFRGWLRGVCRHRVFDHFRARQDQAAATGGTTANQRLQQHAVLDDNADEADSEICRMRHRALSMLRGQFDEHVWRAFVRVTIHGDRAADVAEDLGISISTVYRARFRVLERLQDELAGLEPLERT